MLEKQSQYASAIEHFAKTVWPSPRWREVLMAVQYTACFDASGDESNSQFLVAGGFLSSADDWINFSAAWNKRLGKDGLPYLHMREFAPKAPPFDRLSESKRRALLSDLYDIIRANAYRKFVYVVQNNIMRTKLSPHVKALYYFNSYVMAGRGAVAKVRMWMDSQKMASPLQLVFAKGDVGEGDLRRRLEEDGFPNLEFRYPIDKVINGISYPGFIPLQACDFLAYEFFKAVKSGGIERWGGESFATMPGEMGIVTENDLKETQQWIEVNEEISKWILAKNIPLPKGTRIRKIRLPGGPSRKGKRKTS
jgi:hypothetical protein